MKSNLISLCLGISLFAFLPGCNPYNSEFKCGRDVPFGQCASTQEIYQQETSQGQANDKAHNAAPGSASKTPTPAESAYREAELNKIAKMLKEPVTPVVVPPPVMRILIVPHQGEYGELNMPQTIFMFVGKPKFVMGNYLNGQPGSGSQE